MFAHILMPTDGTDHSERAIKRGIELAKLCGAKVTGIHVMPAYRLAISDEGSFDPGLHGKMDAEARARGELSRFGAKRRGSRRYPLRDSDSLQLATLRRHHQHGQ